MGLPERLSFLPDRHLPIGQKKNELSVLSVPLW